MSKPSGPTSLTEYVRSRGGRLTRQRRLVLQVLEESSDHLDASDLYELAKQRDPNISLATVYRSLALLKESGLVEEHRLGENHAHFEKIQKAPHAHFTCLSCGQVLELDNPRLMQTARRIGEKQGLQVLDLSLELSGYCPSCRKDNHDPLE